MHDGVAGGATFHLLLMESVQPDTARPAGTREIAVTSGAYRAVPAGGRSTATGLHRRRGQRVITILPLALPCST